MCWWGGRGGEVLFEVAFSTPVAAATSSAGRRHCWWCHTTRTSWTTCVRMLSTSTSESLTTTEATTVSCMHGERLPLRALPHLSPLQPSPPPSDSFKKMFQQRQRELEKQYNQQVKDLKAKKMAGQSSKKAVSAVTLVAGEGGGRRMAECWHCLRGLLGAGCTCPVKWVVA